MSKRSGRTDINFDEPFNPYAPPRRGQGPPDPRLDPRRWAEGAARALAVVLGFSLVADPTALPGIATPIGRAIGGHVFARGVGAGLLGVGFLPWRRRPARAEGGPAGPDGEEL